MIQGTDVTLELKVRSMEHTIVQVLTLYEGKLNEEIKDLVKDCISGFDFHGQLEQELRYEVMSTLRQLCLEAMQGKVRQLLSERIEKAFKDLEKPEA